MGKVLTECVHIARDLAGRSIIAREAGDDVPPTLGSHEPVRRHVRRHPERAYVTKGHMLAQTP